MNVCKNATRSRLESFFSDDLGRIGRMSVIGTGKIRHYMI